jgi:hypothetical protein
MIVSPVGEGNPRMSGMVNLAAVLNTELDHALDELGKVWAEVAELRAECAARTILMVVLLPLSGFSTLTVYRPVVASTMVPQTTGPE